MTIYFQHERALISRGIINYRSIIVNQLKYKKWLHADIISIKRLAIGAENRRLAQFLADDGRGVVTGVESVHHIFDAYG